MYIFLLSKNTYTKDYYPIYIKYINRSNLKKTLGLWYFEQETLPGVWVIYALNYVSSESIILNPRFN